MVYLIINMAKLVFELLDCSRFICYPCPKKGHDVMLLGPGWQEWQDVFECQIAVSVCQQELKNLLKLLFRFWCRKSNYLAPHTMLSNFAPKKPSLLS
jgi:hypothetical protein